MSEMWHPGQAEVEDEQSRPYCPYCDRVMSDREATEQGSCNECYEAQQEGNIFKWESKN